MQPVVAGIALAAGEHPSMVTKLEDEGVIKEALLLKFGYKPSNVIINDRMEREVVRVLLPKQWGVGVIGEERDVDRGGRRVGLCRPPLKKPPLMGVLQGLHMKERLPRRPVFVGRFL